MRAFHKLDILMLPRCLKMKETKMKEERTDGLAGHSSTPNKRCVHMGWKSAFSPFPCRTPVGIAGTGGSIPLPCGKAKDWGWGEREERRQNDDVTFNFSVWTTSLFIR